MKEFIGNLTTNLDTWGELAEVLLNALSLICIIAGVVFALTGSFDYRKRNPGQHPMHNNFRLIFGGWLVVALEFQLAADIVSTIISPTSAHLIELGVVAVIRTFLNYFLGKELKEEKESLEILVKKTKEQKTE